MHTTHLSDAPVLGVARARIRPLAGLHPEVRRGARSMAVLMAGYLPFGLTLGAAIGAHPEPVTAWLAAFAIYSGTAHLAVVQLTAEGVALPVVVVTALLIQSRLAVYALSLARHWRAESLRVRALLAATLVEPSWVAATDRYGRPGSAVDKRRHHLGAVVALTVGWLSMITAGMVVGPSVTAGTGLHLAAPLCLVAMLLPRLDGNPSRVALLAAVPVAVVAAPLPAGTGLLVAIAAATAAGAAASTVAARREVVR
jgi:predicted branched-subunit amino acid permease